jgi:hypothetical protein
MDYNIDPGPIWAASDEAGRSGMREVMYINGLYTMWDAILAAREGNNRSITLHASIYLH